MEYQTVTTTTPTTQKTTPRQRIKFLVLGGDNTYIAYHHYQVSIELNGEHNCGGSIIKPYWVLTAAHCVYGIPARHITVRAGTSYREQGGFRHRAVYTISHKFYKDDKTFDFDVGLIKVSSRFKYSNTVGPISLTSYEPRVGTPVTLTGWGKLHHNGPSPYRLQTVNLSIIDPNKCARRYGGPKRFTTRMICAGVPREWKGSCKGDSGGPLVANGKLVGIVSWGTICGDPRSPGVYSNVAFFKDWIINNTH